MSFATEIENPNSKKIVLAEIDIPIDNETLINHEAGIWFTLLTSNGVTVEGSSFEEGYYAVTNEVVYNIQSVLVDGLSYLKVDSISALRDNTEAFYYDYDNRTIYIHFVNSDWPLDRSVKLGAVDGFCNEVESSGCYYGDVYYDPRLISVPSLKKSKDPLFFGLLKYQPASILFNNEDGFFDYYEDKDVFGQPVRIKIGVEGLDFDDFRLAYTGFIEDFSYDFSTFNLRAMDNRKKLSRTIPIRQFTQSVYADLLDDDVNRVKPLAYGSIKNAPCILIDEDTDYEFMFMDTTDHDATALTAVYVNGIEVTPDSSDLAEGTFVILDADFADGDEVTSDFTGASGISNGLDVISDLLDIYSNIKYNVYNYNTTEWETEKANVKDVGLYIGEKIKISDVIEEICVACDVLFFNQDDGKFTARTWDKTRAISNVIQTDEWLEDPKKTLNSKEFLSSVEIKYNKDQSEDTFETRTNYDYDLEVFNRFKVRKEKTFETILTNSTDADDKSETVMQLSKELYPSIARSTKLQNIDLEIMDFIYAEHDRESATPKNWFVYEVIGKTIDLAKYETAFNLKFVDAGPVFEGIATENKYCVQGDPLTTGLTLDSLNAAGGTVPDGFGPLYGSGFYGGDTYSENAFYESDLITSDTSDELTAITITAVGTKINFQYRTYDGFDLSDWSAQVDTLGTVTHTISGPSIQVRFIFGSETWADDDSVIIDEVI